MAVRSLSEIWIDANFKETQLRDLRIGQAADLYVDMYGDKQVFKGRITGFTMGTGSTLALLPAQNATGNFIKIVQRLPVRIELRGLRSGQEAAVHRHIGCSHVYLDKPLSGPNAGAFLQASFSHSPAGGSGCERARCRQMTDLALSPSRPRADVNPWLVAAVVIIPTFMEVLDTTIAVVALRYIAGGLSATVDDGEWVITSYLAANAIILPISGWLSARLGRRNYFLLSIAVFTLASGLCGMATSLGQLIFFRVLQGLAGGGLQPSSQGVLLDAFPVREARHCDDAVRPGGAVGAGRRSDPRRLDHRQLFVAMGVLHQRAGWPRGAWCVLCPAARSRTISPEQREELNKQPLRFD